MQTEFIYKNLAKRHNLIFKGVQKDIDGSVAFIYFNDTLGAAKHATYAILAKGFDETKLLRHIIKKRIAFGVYLEGGI